MLPLRKGLSSPMGVTTDRLRTAILENWGEVKEKQAVSMSEKQCFCSRGSKISSPLRKPTFVQKSLDDICSLTENLR